jgi:hypothetical protein
MPCRWDVADDACAADIFASGDSSDKVATEWYHKYQAEDAAAVTDLVNCILLSAGCDQRVTEDDIRDPENCSNRLADLQNVYTEVRQAASGFMVLHRANTDCYRRESPTIPSFPGRSPPSLSAICWSASSGLW